jgi:hypothetical protein
LERLTAWIYSRVSGLIRFDGLDNSKEFVVESKTSFNNKLAAVVAAGAVVLGAVLGVAGVVSAQSEPLSECTGDVQINFGTEFFGLDGYGNRLMSTSPTVREFALSTPLPAGTYDLSGVSYDGYINRELTPPQTLEQWYAELVSADGTVLATSGTTGDIDDGVEEATWSGLLGEVTIAEPATLVRTVHAAPGSANANSVRPVCLGATGGPVVPPAPDSMIRVIFESTAPESATVALVCGDLQESALGNSIDLALASVPASSGCTVQYPSNLDCTVAVDPEATRAAAGDGTQNIRVPDVGGAKIVVMINCELALIASASATTTPPEAVVETEVASKVEIAPTAQVQPGTPSFTG